MVILNTKNDRPLNYVSCCSPLDPNKSPYDGRFLRKTITHADAVDIARVTREYENFNEIVHYLSKPIPEFFVAKFNLKSLHNGEVEDVFTMLLKQRMVCSIDIDMCYSCFDHEDMCDMILRILNSQFCIRIVHITY